MRTQKLTAAMTVVEFTGKVQLVLANGHTRPLQPGEVLPAGSELQVDDKAHVMLMPPEAVAAADHPVDVPAPAAGGEGEATAATADIKAIQQALLQGIDPTQLQATAAGGAAGAGGGTGSGNDGFVSIDRTGDATLASAGYDTTYQPYTLSAAPSDTAATATSITPTPAPEPVINETSATVSEANLNRASETDPDLVNGSAASVSGSSSQINGTVAVDFGGISGTVAFGDLASMPALSSGGQALGWTLSADGSVLTGSVNGVTLLSVTLNSDGSYVVDLDGPLDSPQGNSDVVINIPLVATNTEGSTGSGVLTVSVVDDVGVVAQIRELSRSLVI